jgi:hypothetical protein
MDYHYFISPTFKYQCFDGFLGYFNTHSKELVTILKETFGKDKDKAVDLHPILCQATIAFISRMYMHI